MARITDSFKEQVYAVVEQIPCGKVLSYQSVAVLAGYPRYARQVGYVLRQLPPNRLLPCHRVVTSIGRLVPHWAGPKELLHWEGVDFTSRGYVNMKRVDLHYTEP